MTVVRASVFGHYFREAALAVEREWPEYESWIIEPSDPYEYGKFIREAWLGESSLVLVEHDVVPPPLSVYRLIDCPRPWCAHEISLGDHLSPRTLGLVKFSRSLQLALPQLAAMALPGAGSGYPQVHWRSVDSALVRVLDFMRVPLHVHQPPAQHLHRYPASEPAGPAPATPGRPA